MGFGFRVSGPCSQGGAGCEVKDGEGERIKSVMRPLTGDSERTGAARSRVSQKAGGLEQRWIDCWNSKKFGNDRNCMWHGCTDQRPVLGVNNYAEAGPSKGT